ncbi:MAG: hypothetical protein JO255_02990, partial [Alphaproteobacteria bacterium]|nr:hypothetical protein [Alphaproteobacteria bacterium]
MRLTRLGLMLAGLMSCAALGLETALSIPDAASSPEPPRHTLAPAAPVAAVPVDDTALVTEIAARPLFTPGRRPPAPPQAAPPVVAEEVAKPEWNWRLAGLMIAPGRREALFLRQGEQRTVSEGQEIDGWILAAVRADGVMLLDGDGTKKLSPELQPPKVAPGQAAWANRAVMATQRQQRLDIKSAEGLLAAASKKMQALQA